MHFLTPFTILLTAAYTTTSALKAPVNPAGRKETKHGDDWASCPPVWDEISATLTREYLANGQCTDAARGAIRAAFHDCFNGACDGSLILADECSRSENRGLPRVCGSLAELAKEKKVGVADLIQFAAAHAIKTCGGPTVPVKIGRKDSHKASPVGQIPPHNTTAKSLMNHFAAKGFSVTDLVALVGAHSTAKQFATDPAAAGASLDSTPGQWNNEYYAEVKRGTAPFILEADKSLAEDLLSGVPFSLFAVSQSAWAAAFVPAMAKLSMLGVGGDLTDCTSALPGGSYGREIRKTSVWERLRW
ncbi:heme peroxidase [Westerdykella ornata]|uniref:Peroxidase n=1 Tax=Westerdykella ornata TaxID=318751 RepID=A0A6A6JVB3_WESOR|nr:heme peroxidase [Westerdykella ornata]KAF2280551.1 heme peroxidase [Westerdykella ornata]